MNIFKRLMIDKGLVGWNHSVVLMVCVNFLVLAVLIKLFESSWFDQLQVKSIASLEFNLRTKANRSAHLSPKLKVIVFDDTVVADLGAPGLSAVQWATVLKRIAEAKPALVMIDSHFGTFAQTSEKDFKEFSNALAQLTSVNGLFIGETPLWGAWAQLDSNKESRPHWQYALSGDTALVKSGRFFYGADRHLRTSIAKAGHLNIAEWGLVYPVVKIEGTEQASLFMPIAAFTATDQSALVQNGGRTLKISDREIELDGFGRLHPNLVSSGEIFENSRPIAEYLGGESSPSNLMEGDIVAILPQYYTGGTDFKDTSIGRVPGGVIITSVANSMISGEWIHHITLSKGGVLILGILGALVGALPSTMYSIVIFAAMIVGLTSFGLISFAYANTQFNWLVADLSFGSLWLLNFARATILQAIQVRATVKALKGLVSDSSLVHLLKNKGRIDLASREVEVTVLFLDMVGFSAFSQGRPSDEVFAILSENLSSLTQTILSFGGTVDRTLGDGLLAYFGYSYVSGATQTHHARDAFTCAVKILQEVSAKQRSGHASTLGIRIGLHTSQVTVGNLGARSGRIDFTVIGDGVNYASRLEQASSEGAVLLSTRTYELISREAAFRDFKFHFKSARFKYHSSASQAYEWLFVPTGELAPRPRSELDVPARDREMRYWLEKPGDLAVIANLGQGIVTNFSANGMRLVLDIYLARGMLFECELHSRVLPELRVQGLKQHYFPLLMEVKWSRPLANGYEHGVRIVNLNDDSRQWLRETLIRLPMQSGGIK